MLLVAPIAVAGPRGRALAALDRARSAFDADASITAPGRAFLARYLRIGADGVHRVAYGLVTPADRAALDAYVAG